jgi:hypothetical protein
MKPQQQNGGPTPTPILETENGVWFYFSNSLANEEEEEEEEEAFRDGELRRYIKIGRISYKMPKSVRNSDSRTGERRRAKGPSRGSNEIPHHKKRKTRNCLDQRSRPAGQREETVFTPKRFRSTLALA